MSDIPEKVVTCENNHEYPLKKLDIVGSDFWCPECGTCVDPPNCNPYSFRTDPKIDPPESCETGGCERKPDRKIKYVVSTGEMNIDRGNEIVQGYRCEYCRKAMEEICNLPVPVFEAVRIDQKP